MVAVDSPTLVEQGLKRTEMASNDEPWFKRPKIIGTFCPPSSSVVLTPQSTLPFPSSSTSSPSPLTILSLTASNPTTTTTTATVTTITTTTTTATAPPTASNLPPMQTEKEKDYAEILLSLRRSSAPSILAATLPSTVTIEELPDKPLQARDSGSVVTASKTIAPTTYYPPPSGLDSFPSSSSNPYGRRHSEPNIASSLTGTGKASAPMSPTTLNATLNSLKIPSSGSSVSPSGNSSIPLSAKIKIRHKRCSNACTEHKRKHQRCPPECPGRKKEIEHQHQFTKMGAMAAPSIPASLHFGAPHPSGQGPVPSGGKNSSIMALTNAIVSESHPHLQRSHVNIDPIHINHNNTNISKDKATDPNVDISNLLNRFLKYDNGATDAAPTAKKTDMVIA